jgi:hypothetical protein
MWKQQGIIHMLLITITASFVWILFFLTLPRTRCVFRKVYRMYFNVAAWRAILQMNTGTSHVSSK